MGSPDFSATLLTISKLLNRKPAGDVGEYSATVTKRLTMKQHIFIPVVSVVVGLAASFGAQAQTLAGLNHDLTPDIPRVRTTVSEPSGARVLRPTALAESSLSRLAATALFVNADLARARRLAARALMQDQQDAEALFVQMEAAAMQADDAAALDAAMRLCEIGVRNPGDLRVQLAAVRVREYAGATTDFRKAIPRVQALLVNSQEPWPELHNALLQAAMDGASGVDPYTVARSAGILTDWRIVGPLHEHSVSSGGEPAISPADDLAKATYGNRPVENFQFPDGRITLPDYLSRRGTFYAATTFASLTAQNWTVDVENPGRVEIFIDGQSVLRASAAGDHTSATFEAFPGPHRVLAKFAGPNAGLRIALTKSVHSERAPIRSRTSARELAYLLAAGDYAVRDYGAAIKQLEAISDAGNSGPLQFLLAQSQSKYVPSQPDVSNSWRKVQALLPTALAAENALSREELIGGNESEAQALSLRVLATRRTNVMALETLTDALMSTSGGITTVDATAAWSARLTAHPSCAGLQHAISFYGPNGNVVETAAAQEKLNGCSPESLDYAQSLAQQGQHARAAAALQSLLAAAPLNRSARQRLIRELQLAGEDGSAQLAAKEWLRIAPNAADYHRLAATGEVSVEPNGWEAPRASEFYDPYRRDAALLARQLDPGLSADIPVLLLEDHVTILRPDGSVSIYTHSARLISCQEGARESVEPSAAYSSQILTQQVIHKDGSVTQLDPVSSSAASCGNGLSAGDILDQEAVLHFAGDGGMQEHPEAFQFVFGSFNQKVLNAKFVVLTPAAAADRGVVIGTGNLPRMRAAVDDGVLARVWEVSSDPDAAPRATNASPAILRLVEQDKGWSTPSNAERQRRIETIHPGPRPENS